MGSTFHILKTVINEEELEIVLARGRIIKYVDEIYYKLRNNVYVCVPLQITILHYQPSDRGDIFCDA